MSRCDYCAAAGCCKYHGKSNVYKTDGNTPVIALLGQPNSGKSTIFNMITGSHQHVGNWPGKTVEQKEGEFRIRSQRMILADLPGSYSLSTGSDEEIITKNFIRSGNADLVLVMADASQLARSLYMLADFAGTDTPAVLLLNMMDVARGQGIDIDTEALAARLGIPVVPMSAIQKKDYQRLYETIDRGLKTGDRLKASGFSSAEEKITWIDNLLRDVMTKSKSARSAYTRFDRAALSPVRGRVIAVGMILVVFLVSMIFAGVVSGAASAGLTAVSGILMTAMISVHTPPLIISLICDVLINVLYFATMMASFVLGITLGFNLMEESGYLARISFLFDNTMNKVGLQGKTIMPFFMGLGCTIAGVTGTRVVDNWGQRILAIAMSWAVPCAATLSVVPTIAMALFGSGGGFLVIISIFAFMFFLIWIVYKVFAKTLSPEEQRVGMIMELPPYHKPDVKNILYVTFRQTLSIFLRALKVISIVSVVFFILIYGFGGNIASLLSQNFTKPEGLAFIFAISFNMPCVSALAATAREAHSVKWTAKIGLFYTIFSLIISCVIYHLALFIF